MKRYIVLMALLAVVMSCNTKIDPDTVGTIVVTATVNGQTKAGYDDGNLPMNIVMDINQNTDKYNYSWVELEKNASNNQYEAKAPLRWASDDRAGVIIKAMTLPFGETSIGENPMTVSVSQDQSVRENLEASDLLGASTGNGVTIDGNNVKIDFYHLMAKLLVSYQLGDGLAGNVTVNSATLQNVCTAGGYSYSNMDYAAEISKEYADVTMYHDVDAKTLEAVFYPYTPSENTNLLMNVAIGGTIYDLSCPVNPNGAFVGGKRYKLNVTIVGSAINGVAANVIGWDTETQDQDFVTE